MIHSHMFLQVLIASHSHVNQSFQGPGALVLSFAVCSAIGVTFFSQDLTPHLSQTRQDLEESARTLLELRVIPSGLISNVVTFRLNPVYHQPAKSLKSLHCSYHQT